MSSFENLRIVDNFYQTYYKPERMLLLEEDGVVQSMTAWFDTQLVLPGEGRFRAAYLYGKGLFRHAPQLPQFLQYRAAHSPHRQVRHQLHQRRPEELQRGRQALLAGRRAEG